MKAALACPSHAAAISEPDEAGMRTVMCILNGQLSSVSLLDRSVTAQAPAAETWTRS